MKTPKLFAPRTVRAAPPPEFRDHAEPDDAWRHAGRLARTREDRLAEGIAVSALLLALGVGLVVAMLPAPDADAPHEDSRGVVQASAAQASTIRSHRMH